MEATREFARFVYDTTLERIPAAVREIAKEQLLDCLGVSLAGALHPAARIAREHVRQTGGTAEATVLGGGLQTSAPNACFANGVAAHVLDYDDTWLPTGHPTCTLLPVLLALAERDRLSGRELLEAYVLGTEVHGKLGYGWTPIYAGHFHATGVYGVMGATAASAKLLGLDQEQITMAFGIAVSSASGLALNTATTGSMTKSFHAGHNARNGLVAAMLAKEGFTAAPQAIEGHHGFAEAFIGPGLYDVQSMVNRLGNPYHLLSPGIAIKRYPCCYIIHQGVEALLELVEEHNISIKDVETVETEVPPGYILDLPEPHNDLAAKFSAQFCMGVALAQHQVTIGSFSRSNLSSPEVREAVSKVRLVHNPDIPLALADMYTPIRVHLKNRKSLSHRVDVPKGHWNNRLPRAEIVGKYRDNASLVLPAPDVERSAELLLGLEKQQDLSELMEILGRPAAAYV